MKTFKKIIKFFPAFLLILSIQLGFNPAFAETADSPHTAKNLNLSGLYLGFYPCDDCHGIRTTLALNKNNTYVMITIYVGKSDREFIEKGKFAIGENGDTVVLTPKKGGTVAHQYLIDDDMLIKLDEDGNRITKDGADRFILKRKDVVKAQEKHTGH
ncbi:MAG: copper resistance protein NlpE N-terminal domain-containing protein [Methylococcaceae bacterium]|nr:copper resistance protein NlpE N-terminal domain-containing protein [Methylococcaceae bacterium]